VAAGGGVGRRARSHGNGGAPVLPRPQEVAEETQQEVAEPAVVSASTGWRRPWRIALDGAPAGSGATRRQGRRGAAAAGARRGSGAA
jgi:hypothetical protein